MVARRHHPAPRASTPATPLHARQVASTSASVAAAAGPVARSSAPGPSSSRTCAPCAAGGRAPSRLIVVTTRWPGCSATCAASAGARAARRAAAACRRASRAARCRACRAARRRGRGRPSRAARRPRRRASSIVAAPLDVGARGDDQRALVEDEPAALADRRRRGAGRVRAAPGSASVAATGSTTSVAPGADDDPRAVAVAGERAGLRRHERRAHGAGAAVEDPRRDARARAAARATAWPRGVRSIARTRPTAGARGTRLALVRVA